jgi:transposase
MEDVLRIYARPYDWKQPVVCLDERPVQLHDSKRATLPMRPNKIVRKDYEYIRKGTANVFCIVEPLTGKRLTHATKNRKARLFARSLGKISKRYRRANKIHLVMDNLNTHKEKSLLQEYGQRRGGKLWRRFKVHYTPKHGSWLNAAEIEAALVSRECLGSRRIASLRTLFHQVNHWRARTEKQHRTINWKFRVADARKKFKYDGIITPRSEH